MEGITGHLFRSTFTRYFGTADAYYTPFISPNTKESFSHRALSDILPEHNQGMNLVPQILTNDPELFLGTAKTLQSYGYQTVNLNLGCPSKTVTGKKKGSGLLLYPEELEEFLDRIFSGTEMKISIKTRIGFHSEEEFAELLSIFNHFPIDELIVHPRLQKEYYQGSVHLDAFALAERSSSAPLCYNGDILTLHDAQRIAEQFPRVKHVMIGRGFLKNPWLLKELSGCSDADRKDLTCFHDELLAAYCAAFDGDRAFLSKIKELWYYLAGLFPDAGREIREICKAERMSVYRSKVEALFSHAKLVIPESDGLTKDNAERQPGGSENQAET